MGKTYHENYPFLHHLPDLKLVVDEMKLSDVKAVVDSDGVVTNHASASLAADVHISCIGKFVRLMTDNISIMANLPKSGLNVLWPVIVMIQQDARDRAYFHMNYDQAALIAKGLGYSLTKSAYYRGVDVLIEREMIAKASKTGRYWINVGVLFNGDFAKLPEIQAADPIYLIEQNLVKQVKGRK